MLLNVGLMVFVLPSVIAEQNGGGWQKVAPFTLAGSVTVGRAAVFISSMVYIHTPSPFSVAPVEVLGFSGITLRQGSTFANPNQFPLFH